MKEAQIVTKSLIAMAVMIALVLLARYTIVTNNFPSIDQYIASSTPAYYAASSTESAHVKTGEYLQSDALDVKSPSFAMNYSTTTIVAPRGTIIAEVSDDEAKLGLGLGGRDSLSPASGMLFVFEQPGFPGFWMKDMRFALDIIWLNADHVVVGLAPNLTPDTYPNVVYPPSPVKYVLEVNAGTADRFGIATGTMLRF